jgi:glutamine amidotransferase
MCRLLAYTGSPIYLDSLLVHQKTSLIAQSLAAREAKTIVNGDGSGLGWYDKLLEPGLYRSTLPAWSDSNLASLCKQLQSRLFMAHVRAATSGEVTRENCHPFTSGRHLFAHNGQIGDYDALRRQIDSLIPDALYGQRRGTGDSESIFLTAMGDGLDTDPVGAITRTLNRVMALLKTHNASQPVRFAALHSDGRGLWAYRWASDNKAPSLYWRQMQGGIVVASEPFDPGCPDWNEVPAQSVLLICPKGTMGSEPLKIDGQIASHTHAPSRPQGWPCA